MSRTVLRSLWTRWKVIAEKIGHFQTKVILTLAYFVVVAPFALVVRISRDPLGLRGFDGSNWVPKGAVRHDLDVAHKQY
jgi:hypothetical protein